VVCPSVRTLTISLSGLQLPTHLAREKNYIFTTTLYPKLAVIFLPRAQV
jgi:hypothetical protein